jgi:hypothetical protein
VRARSGAAGVGAIRTRPRNYCGRPDGSGRLVVGASTSQVRALSAWVSAMRLILPHRAVSDITGT